MKHYTILFYAIFISCSFSYAQEYQQEDIYYLKTKNNNNALFNVSHFEAEKKVIYQVTGTIPGSDIAFYSNDGGGQMMKKITSDESGNAIIYADKNFAPAAALNIMQTNSKGVAGCGKVYFIGIKEFILDNIEVKRIGASSRISWEAVVNDPDIYSFQLLKSLNGEKYSVIEQHPAYITQGKVTYTFTDPDVDQNVDYKINVLTNRGNIKYTSASYFLNATNDLLIYPTIANTEINILISQGDEVSTYYQIVDIQGKTIQQGKIYNPYSVISLMDASPGPYVMKIYLGKVMLTRQFLKL